MGNILQLHYFDDVECFDDCNGVCLNDVWSFHDYNQLLQILLSNFFIIEFYLCNNDVDCFDDYNEIACLNGIECFNDYNKLVADTF